MCPFSVDHERAEALIALGQFPEQHDGLGSEPNRVLRPWDIRSIGLQRLMQYPRHAVHNELEILGPVEPASKVPVIVLGCQDSWLFWDRIEQNYQEELQSVSDEYLFGILKDKSVVRYTPSGRVILECLAHC